MTPKQVIIVGASVRALTQSAVRAGYQVTAIDQFCDFDTGAVADLVPYNEFSAWIQTSKKNSNLSVYAGGMENHPEQVDWLDEHSTLLGNPPSILRELHNRWKLHSFLSQAGIEVPESYSVAEFQEISREQGHQQFQSKLFLRKKFFSCGGLGIRKVQLPVSLNKHNVDEDDTHYYQQFIDGQVFSASFLGFGQSSDFLDTNNSMLLGITRQLCGDSRFNASGFQYCGSIIEPNPAQQMIDVVSAMGKLLCQKFGLKGLFNIDLIKSGEQIYFLEVNPRYSASMELLERQFGYNLFEFHRAACLGDRNSLNSSINRVTSFVGTEEVIGKAIWYADRTLVVDDRFPGYAASQIDSKGQARISDIPPGNTRINAGSPMFTVFASGTSALEVENQLLKNAKMFASQIEVANFSSSTKCNSAYD